MTKNCHPNKFDLSRFDNKNLQYKVCAFSGGGQQNFRLNSITSETTFIPVLIGLMLLSVSETQYRRDVMVCNAY